MVCMCELFAGVCVFECLCYVYINFIHPPCAKLFVNGLTQLSNKEVCEKNDGKAVKH